MKFPFGQYVCELVLGVNVFDFDFWVQIDPVKQPIQSDSVSSRHMSHRWTSSFDNHLMLKNVQLRLILRRMCVSGYVILIRQLINFLSSFVSLGLGFGIGSRTCWLGWTVLFVERNTSITMSQRSRASIRNQASREMISDSVGLYETELCFLHIQLTGTMYDFRKYTRLSLKLISSLQGRQQTLSLAKTQSLMLSRVAHMTILSEFVCVMNVRNQSC